MNGCRPLAEGLECGFRAGGMKMCPQVNGGGWSVEAGGGGSVEAELVGRQRAGGTRGPRLARGPAAKEDDVGPWGGGCLVDSV
jgi:hypothetical protein